MRNFNFKPLNRENKVIILLLVIFLFGLLILNTKKQKSYRCTKKVIYTERRTNPYVITNHNEMPEWVVNLKKKNMEKCLTKRNNY
jgi:hypothetical protein